MHIGAIHCLGRAGPSSRARRCDQSRRGAAASQRRLARSPSKHEHGERTRLGRSLLLGSGSRDVRVVVSGGARRYSHLLSRRGRSLPPTTIDGSADVREHFAALRPSVLASSPSPSSACSGRDRVVEHEQALGHIKPYGQGMNVAGHPARPNSLVLSCRRADYPRPIAPTANLAAVSPEADQVDEWGQQVPAIQSPRGGGTASRAVSVGSSHRT